MAQSVTATDSVADLAIRVPESVHVIPGEMTIYTLTVRNDGPDLATSVVLTDVLPNGVIPAWVQSAQPVCTRQERSVGCDVGDLGQGSVVTVTLDLAAGGTVTLITGTRLAGVTPDLSAPTCAIEQGSAQPRVTCHLAHLQPGADAQMRIGVDVDAGTMPLHLPSLVHTATVTANEADADHANNRAAFTMTVAPSTVTAVLPTTDLVLEADGPSTVMAGQPFTYTYTITNRGALDATGVWFEDVVPSDLNLVAYAPGLPLCEQQGDAFTCHLRDLDSGESVTFTLVITGYGEQPMVMSLDPLIPGWPICSMIKERTWLHIVQCELGVLEPGQATHVQLVFVAIGVRERTTVNTASLCAGEADPNSVDNTSTTTITVQVGAEPSRP
jgi:uncharacterized repeat protein (TIGR01451 family)